MNNEAIEQFKKHGDKASYHYADDSCREWGLADKEKANAIAVFDSNPSEQEEMRRVARGFLWGYELTQLRPISTPPEIPPVQSEEK